MESGVPDLTVIWRGSISIPIKANTSTLQSPICLIDCFRPTGISVVLDTLSQVLLLLGPLPFEVGWNPPHVGIYKA